MLVVKTVHLQEKGRLARHEVALHDLGDVLEGGDDIRVLVVLGQVHADERADVESERIRLDDHPRTGDDTVALHLVDALVDGSPGDAAFAGDFQERHAGIVDQVGKDFPVD